MGGVAGSFLHPPGREERGTSVRAVTWHDTLDPGLHVEDLSLLTLEGSEQQ